MVSQRFTQFVVVFSLAVAAVASAASSANAQDRLRLATRFNGIKAQAKYEERVSQGRYKFNFQLERGTPGLSGTVSANTSGVAVTVGSFVVDSFGRGIIDIDTSEGDAVPDLAVGTVITVQYNGKTYSGTLQPR